MFWRQLNFLSLVASGLYFFSTLYPWWGLDIGMGYSFRWSMWEGPLVNIGPPQPYSWINNVNQVLSSGTSIVGTLALVTAVLAFVGARPRRSRFFEVGFALSVLIPFLLPCSCQCLSNCWAPSLAFRLHFRDIWSMC